MREHQFPENVETDVTIYTRWIDLDGTHHNKRIVLNGCFWRKKIDTDEDARGTQIPSKIVCIVPFRATVTGKVYIEFDEWLKLSDTDGYWSINTDPFDEIHNLPLIYKGILDFDFDPGTSSEVTDQENELTGSNPKVERVTFVGENLFGSIELRHIVIHA